MTTETKTLTAGETYDIDTLEFSGWNNGEENDGYNCWDYFSSSGEYLGADEDGIEPVFAAEAI